MLDIIVSAAKGGWKSSEFWLAVAAIVLPQASSAADSMHGTTGVIASAAVAAAYAVGRSYVKGQTIKAAAPPYASIDASLTPAPDSLHATARLETKPLDDRQS